jgi:hypothetical protein
MESRERIIAVLRRQGGPGSNVLRIATETRRAANVGPWPYPIALARALIWTLRPLTTGDERARVVGRVLEFRQGYGDSARDWGMNLFFAIAMGQLGAGASLADIYALAGCLALTEKRVDTDADMLDQQFLPEWFIVEFQRARVVGNASGVLRLAVGGRRVAT